jgi:hypothetical protein
MAAGVSTAAPDPAPAANAEAATSAVGEPQLPRASILDPSNTVHHGHELLNDSLTSRINL